MTLVVGAIEPILSKPSPIGYVNTSSNQILFIIESLDEQIQKTTELSFIRIFDENNIEVLKIDST